VLIVELYKEYLHKLKHVNFYKLYINHVITKYRLLG